MTEQDYIDVRDLSNVLNADRILRETLPANQPLIPDKEYREVMRKLGEWREALFEKIKERRDQTEATTGRN